MGVVEFWGPFDSIPRQRTTDLRNYHFSARYRSSSRSGQYMPGWMELRRDVGEQKSEHIQLWLLLLRGAR
jgi:hypothetical protein